MKYSIYNMAGVKLRVVDCPPTLAALQVHAGELILEGEVNDETQKVVAGKIVDKTPEEIELANPTLPEPEPASVEKQPAFITNEQWQDVLERLKKLETKT